MGLLKYLVYGIPEILLRRIFSVGLLKEFGQMYRGNLSPKAFKVLSKPLVYKVLEIPLDSYGKLKTLKFEFGVYYSPLTSLLESLKSLLNQIMN